MSKMQDSSFEHELETYSVNFEQEPEKTVEDESVVFKRIFTVTRSTPLNQPHVKPVPTFEPDEGHSSVSYQKYGVDSALTPMTPISQVSSRSGAYGTSVSTMSEGQLFNDMFTTALRKMANRNKFTQHIFFVLGLQMCFSFVFYLFLKHHKQICTFFEDRQIQHIFVITSTILIKVVVLCACLNPRWLRVLPNPVILLALSTVSVTIQFAVLGLWLNFITILIYITGSFMVMSFVFSMLASQRKVEATGKIMSLVFIILSIILSVGITVLLAYVAVKELVLKDMGIAIVIVLADCVLVLLVIHHSIKDRSIVVGDFIYVTLMAYLSITTIFIFLMIIKLILRLRKQKEVDQLEIDI